MRFHHKFSRFKTVIPAGEIALGADVDPTTLAIDAAADARGQTNVLHARFANSNGWPCHRIAVGYHPPSGALALVATAYLYDVLSGFWYITDAVGTSLVANKITYFDFVSVPELPAVERYQDQGVGNQCDFYLLVTDPGAAPAGEHLFVLAPDLTTPGL
jgi:hypothetical protein